MGSVCYVVSIVPRQHLYEQTRTSSNRTSSKGRIYQHTQQTTPFPSGCSPLMRNQDDWCRMIKASPRPRAWLGKGWIGSLSAAGSSANSGGEFRLNFDEISSFRYMLHERSSNDQDQPESSSQWFAYPYFRPWWPVAPGRRPEYPLSLMSPNGHWLGTGVFCCFETNRHFVDYFGWPRIIPQKKKSGGLHKLKIVLLTLAASRRVTDLYPS